MFGVPFCNHVGCGRIDQRDIMSHYETMIIVDAMISEDAIEREIKKIEARIEAQGQIIKTDIWGKRKLAYDIRKKSHGFYAVIYYNAPTTIIAELERDFRINENILRWITLADQPLPDFSKREAALAENDADIDNDSDKAED
jgi:small subunit ribosomal protein S6